MKCSHTKLSILFAIYVWMYIVYIELYGRIYDKSTYAKMRRQISDTVINSTIAFSPGREYACTVTCTPIHMNYYAGPWD